MSTGSPIPVMRNRHSSLREKIVGKRDKRGGSVNRKYKGKTLIIYYS